MPSARARCKTTRVANSCRPASLLGLLPLRRMLTLVGHILASAMPEVTHVGMEDLGENLGTLDEPRSGPVEEGGAVREEHPAPAPRPQTLPDCVVVEHTHLGRGCGDVVAARRHEDHIGVG